MEASEFVVIEHEGDDSLGIFLVMKLLVPPSEVIQ